MSHERIMCPSSLSILTEIQEWKVRLGTFRPPFFGEGREHRPKAHGDRPVCAADGNTVGANGTETVGAEPSARGNERTRGPTVKVASFFSWHLLIYWAAQ